MEHLKACFCSSTFVCVHLLWLLQLLRIYPFLFPNILIPNTGVSFLLVMTDGARSDLPDFRLFLNELLHQLTSPFII